MKDLINILFEKMLFIYFEVRKIVFDCNLFFVSNY